MKNLQRAWILYIVFSLNFLTVKELNTERHFIVWSAKLIQHVYYKAILISEFGSKDMVLWKRGSSLVFTEDETLYPHIGLLSQYGMIDHALLKGCSEYLQKITSLNC